MDINTSIVSHSLVKNGKPFIDIVLRQVIPFVNRALITISEKSNDGTLDIIRRLEKEYPQKVRIDFENVAELKDLTLERQKQLDNSHEDWIWFLDDDDYWSTSAIEEVLKHLNDDVDGLSFSPYQLLDLETHDSAWFDKRSFTKLFRNQPGVHYRHPFPRDLIYLNEGLLHWKWNHRVTPIKDIRYYHLQNLKNNSFRNEKWSKGHYIRPKGNSIKLPPETKNDIDIIQGEMIKYGRNK